MNSIFRQDYQSWKDEATELSPVWWVWLPVVVLLVLPVWAYLSLPSYKFVFQNEKFGLLEISHAVFPFAASLIALRLLFKSEIRKDPIIALALIVLLVGGIYLAGEELSWGQHHFGWATSDYWSTINRQDETNIHNTSAWANHVPRAILTVLIVLGGTLFPLVKKYRPQWTFKRLDFLYPPRALVVSAFIVLALEGLVQLGNHYELSQVVKFHDGELQEFFIVLSVLIYAIFLQKRARHAA